MGYAVTFREIGGHVEQMGYFPTHDKAIGYIRDNVCVQDLECLGAAHINGVYEPWTLFQGDEILGCYRIVAS
ncbi:MAG: hypothetical protein IKZ87_05000 [Actinomycetaceae bacterium]|nr:hypothetical protein [Actinomycetaceae bacterium]